MPQSTRARDDTIRTVYEQPPLIVRVRIYQGNQFVRHGLDLNRGNREPLFAVGTWFQFDSDRRLRQITDVAQNRSGRCIYSYSD